MSYLVLAVLAATAGALLGAVRREDLPWHRPHPLRRTFSLGLMAAALFLLIGGDGLGWARRPLARDPILLTVIVMEVIAVWIAPRPAVWWSRLTFTLALARLAFKVYAPHS